MRLIVLLSLVLVSAAAWIAVSSSSTAPGVVVPVATESRSELASALDVPAEIVPPSETSSLAPARSTTASRTEEASRLRETLDLSDAQTDGVDELIVDRDRRQQEILARLGSAVESGQVARALAIQTELIELSRRSEAAIAALLDDSQLARWASESGSLSGQTVWAGFGGGR